MGLFNNDVRDLSFGFSVTLLETMMVFYGKACN